MTARQVFSRLCIVKGSSTQPLLHSYWVLAIMHTSPKHSSKELALRQGIWVGLNLRGMASGLSIIKS